VSPQLGDNSDRGNLPAANDGGADAQARAEEISRLFREHNRALVNFVLTRVANEQEAKEVAQEAYVRLLQLDQSVAVNYLRWHLFKIAKHIAVDRYRQYTTRARLDRLDAFEELDLKSPTESSVMAADELAKLMAALGELPNKCQQAFLLHKLRDLSTSEIAVQMGVTDRTVRNYVHRALLYCRLRSAGVAMDQALKQADS
jgi:RNA polymerase sigma factor (sigma-70 family)